MVKFPVSIYIFIPMMLFFFNNYHCTPWAVLGTNGVGNCNLSPLQQTCKTKLFGYVTTENVIIRYVVTSWFKSKIFYTFNTMLLSIFFLTAIICANSIQNLKEEFLSVRPLLFVCNAQTTLPGFYNGVNWRVLVED